MKNNLLKSKSAQAEVITTVLIILLVLVAVIIVWNVVNRTIKEGSEEVGLSSFKVNLDVKEIKPYVTGGAMVKIKRMAGAGGIDKLKFTFSGNSGELAAAEKSNNLPEELEEKSYEFTPQQINFKIKEVSVVPVYEDTYGVQSAKKISTSEIPSAIPGVPSSPDAPSSPGLVSWWKFEGNFLDSTGTNNGTKYGGADSSSKKLILDGTGDYVEIPNHASLNPANITFSTWIKDNNGSWRSSSYDAILSKRNVYIFYPHSPSSFDCHIFARNISSGSDIWWATSSINIANLTQWHMISCTYNGTTITGYLDGVKKASISAPAMGALYTGDTGVLTIGRDDGYSTYFNGEMDNAMFFNKSLSPEEILAIYNNQKE